MDISLITWSAMNTYGELFTTNYDFLTFRSDITRTDDPPRPLNEQLLFNRYGPGDNLRKIFLAIRDKYEVREDYIESSTYKYLDLRTSARNSKQYLIVDLIDLFKNSSFTTPEVIPPKVNQVDIGGMSGRPWVIFTVLAN